MDAVGGCHMPSQDQGAYFSSFKEYWLLMVARHCPSIKESLARVMPFQGAAHNQRLVDVEVQNLVSA